LPSALKFNPTPKRICKTKNPNYPLGFFLSRGKKLNENHSQNDSHLQNSVLLRRAVQFRNEMRSALRQSSAVPKRSKSTSNISTYPQVIHKSLRGYPALHPSIVARIFALVKRKLKIIWRDICPLLC
jgi:hypothetical protein